MKTVKIEKLTESQVNYAVAVILGYSPTVTVLKGVQTVWINGHHKAAFTSDWGQAGPILERYAITAQRGHDCYVANTNKYWWAEEDGGTEYYEAYSAEGPYLIAAMRCYVASKLGDEVEIPEELL